MDNSELALVGMLLAAGLSIGAIAYIVLMPFLSGERRADKRRQGVTENRRPIAIRAQADASNNNNRRKQVAETLKELDERQKSRERLTLRVRLIRAGLEIEPHMFWVASAVSGVVIGVFTLLSAPGLPIAVPFAVGVVGTLGLPRWVLARMTKRRQAKFLDEFANAIDVIVRGVKSGLPLTECLGIIARESPQPIAGEFRELVEQQRIGIPLTECFERMMVRMPLPEVRFFSIVIGIAQQAGGNLSEALGNLSGVLRDRKRLQAKVKALSAEAKASAAVLASLPFVVMVLVYITTPSYISLLWTSQIGQFLLMVAAVWMTMGVLVMKKMINFKY